MAETGAPAGGRLIWNSIRWRAALLTSCLVAAVLAGFTWYVVRQVETDLIERAEDRAGTTATILAGQTAQTTQQGQARFQDLARDPAIRDFLNRPADAARVSAIDRIRRFTAPESDQVLELWNARGEQLLRETHPAGSTTRFPAESRPAVAGLSPLEVSGGRLFTRLVGEVTIDGLAGSEALGYIQLVRLVKPTPSATVNGIVGSGATVLIGNQSGHIWTDLEKVVADPRVDISKPEPQEFSGPNGEALIGALSKISGTPWSVLIELPRSVVVAPVSQLLRRLMAAGAAFLVLTTIVAAALSRQVTRPLGELTAAVRNVARGDYSSRVVTNRPDEVGRLAQAFNVMAGEIEHAHRALEGRAAELAGARETADRANRVKDEFLAVLSHELRTPLSAMLGWCQMLRAGVVPDVKRAHAIEVIERNALSQLRLVDDLLDVSRIAAGKFTVDLQQVDPAAVLQAAIESIQPVAQSSGVSIVASVATGIGVVEGDAGRLQQALWNLLSNALKFTPRGGEVTAMARRNGRHVEFVIHDSGQGIPPEALPRIFDRLEQGDIGSSRRHSGLGLGLAIVRQVVELHHGSVEAESAHGAGATFRILIPLLREGPASLKAHAGLSDDRAPSIRGVSILVVEDGADARELLTELLTRQGAIVASVESAEAALAWLDRGTPDLVISDIRMPGLDGLEFMTRVRQRPPATDRRLPAIAVTANAGAEDRAQAYRAGFDAHLSKPIEIPALLTTIATLVGPGQVVARASVDS